MFSGIDANNSIGHGERYNHTLRHILNIVQQVQPELDNNSQIGISIKVINETMEPNVLVLSLLVFGTNPSFPSPCRDRPTQAERFQALILTRAEMETILEENHIKRWLKSKVFPLTQHIIKTGDKARAYTAKTLSVGTVGM